MDHTRWLAGTIATCLFLVAPTLAAAQVELHLRSGQVVTGEILSEDADGIRIRTIVVSKSGTIAGSMTYKRADIAKEVRIGDPAEVYPQKRAAASSPEDHCALALWCRNQGLGSQAVEHAQKAVALDPGQTKAKDLLGELGWVQADGKWVREDEWLKANGKTRYQGEIMTVAEADERRRRETADQDKKNQTQTMAYLDRRLLGIKQQLAEVDADVAEKEAADKKLDAVISDVAIKEAALTSAKKAVEQAQQQPGGTGGTSQPGGSTVGQGPGGPNPAALRQAVETAQKDLQEAKRRSVAAESERARLTAAISALKKSRLKLLRDQEELTQKRTTLQASASAPVSSP